MSPDYEEPGAAAHDGPLGIATRPGAQPLRIGPGIRVNIDNALGEKLKSN